MAEGLGRKRKVRGGHRASTKRTIAALYEAIEATDDLESVVTKLEQCRITLKEKLETLKQLDEEILVLVDDGEVDDEIEQADTFKERIHVAIIASNKALETKQNGRISSTTVPSSVGTTPSVTANPTLPTTTSDTVAITTPLIMSPGITATTPTMSASETELTSTSMTATSLGTTLPMTLSPSTAVPIPSHISLPSLSMTPTRTVVSGASLLSTPTSLVMGHSHGSKVKLPKLVPKKFNGDLTKWSTFWDSFESSIHYHPDLSDIDKFNYLCTLLEGTASEAISGLKLTSSNYREAITILQKRFGNKRQIITKHMDLLLNVEPVTLQHNLKGLRHLYDTVETQVQSLRALGVSADSYGSILSSVFMNKLPEELRLIVSRHVREDEWTLDAIMNVTESEIIARERALGNSCRGPKKITRDPLTASSLFANGSGSPKCSYCHQPHSSNTCRTVTDVSERKQILRRTGRCFVCLRKNHMSRECRSTAKCNKCNGRHHVSICNGGQGRRQEPNYTASTADNPSTPTSTSQALINSQNTHVPTTTASLYCIDARTPVLLQTARASVCKVNNPNISRKVRIIFDCGSQRSYITDELKSYLMLDPVCTETMLIKTFGSEDCSTQQCEQVELEISLQLGDRLKMSFLSVPLICEPISGQSISYAVSFYKELAPLEFSDYAQGDGSLQVDILVGLDQYWRLVTGEVIRCHNGPTAIHTRLGWVLSGPVQGSPPAGVTSVNLVITHSLRVDAFQQQTLGKLDNQLKMFWDLKSLGIKCDESTVYEEFQKKITYKYPRYEVSLPWKRTHPVLHNHYELALRRLNGLLRRLRQNPEILKQYDAVIKEQLHKGIIESVDTSALVTHPVHYLPHHAILREDKKTTKLRIVYDASAKINGPSLNDCLYTGPKFGQKIMDIIIRFRVHRIALTGDIEKAFLMISVAPHDRDVLRFLWIDDILKSTPRIQTFRFTRVIFGVSSSPFLLNATIKHHLEQFNQTFPQFVRSFIRSVYVDDVSFGADNDDAAYELYTKSKDILREGGFNLRKFVTNSTTLQQRIDETEAKFIHEYSKAMVEEEDKTYTKNLLGGRLQQSEHEQKILGVTWNFVNDELIFNLNELAMQIKGTEPTKRSIVAIATKFYDPIGFVAPVIICFKTLFQELCASKIGWDEPLSGELLSKWKQLVSGFRGAAMSIPRCYFGLLTGKETHCSLIGFCDASAGAYAAVVYLRIEGSAGTIVNFVVSKTRVSPVNKQSIPRLELLSALLLAKLISSTAAALEADIQLQANCCFSDSKVALFWIKGSTKEWKPWVENRVNEIRGIVPAECWKYCPGIENPADIPSRGIMPTELTNCRLWRHGPTWLVERNPVLEGEGNAMPDECLKEIKSTRCYVMHASQIMLSLDKIICCKNFGCLRRLLRVTSYVLKFVEQCKSRARASEIVATELTAKDVAKAEIIWVKELQKELLKHKGFPTWKRQFNLFLEGEVWRCGSRLGNSEAPYSAKHPILLIKSHHLAVLIVQDAHERVMHNGVKETLTELRSKYWIIKGRQFVRRVIHKCIICRKLEGPPYALPPPPPLPDFRVTEQPPFMYTGVDFAGPLYIKTQGLIT